MIKAIHHHPTPLALAMILLLVAAMAPSLVSASPAQQGGQTYVVRSGDTLSAIARNFNTSVSAIMQANGLTRTMIVTGQRLFIPSGTGNSILPSGTAPPPPSYGTASSHVVRSGETLSSIAVRYGISVPQLKQANGLVSDRIYVGQVLRIPSSSSPPQPWATPAPIGGGSSSSCGSYYTVRSGDTLLAIAGRCGTTLTALRSANNLWSDTIYVGLVLRIPGSYVPTSTPAPLVPRTTPVVPTPFSRPSPVYIDPTYP